MCFRQIYSLMRRHLKAQMTFKCKCITYIFSISLSVSSNIKSQQIFAVESVQILNGIQKCGGILAQHLFKCILSGAHVFQVNSFVIALV